jgi:hypothetical protein
LVVLNLPIDEKSTTTIVDEVHHHFKKLNPLDGGSLELGKPRNLPHTHKLEILVMDRNLI